jgi:hypothetical protein
MDNAEVLHTKLGDIERGARWFHVLAVVLVVFGCIGVGGGALKLLRLLRDDSVWTAVLSGAWTTAFGALPYFLLAWLARRAADAFTTIAALIREIGEIV